MWLSIQGLVEVAWCLTRIPSSYYGAPWRRPQPSQCAAGSSADGGSAADYSGVQDAAASSDDDFLGQAVEQQGRVPWGGKKIDWAPPELGFIVGVEKLTSYGGL